MSSMLFLCSLKQNVLEILEKEKALKTVWNFASKNLYCNKKKMILLHLWYAIQYVCKKKKKNHKIKNTTMKTVSTDAVTKYVTCIVRGGALFKCLMSIRKISNL